MSLLKTSSKPSKTGLQTGGKIKSSKSGKDRFVYTFGGGKADGTEFQKDLLGGKGANLHGMTRLGLPVPPGFTLSTAVCTYFYAHGKTYPKVLETQVEQALGKMEKQMGRGFGSRKNPLLVSVRSGARA
jgi:pyruvate,orthophosphate dikinase